MGTFSVLPALLLVPLPTLQLVQVSMPISFETIGSIYPYIGAVYFFVCEVFPTLLGTRALLPTLLPALQAPKPVALLPALLLVLLLVLQRCRRKPLQQGLELDVLFETGSDNNARCRVDPRRCSNCFA